MQVNFETIDQFLAGALHSGTASWPVDWSTVDIADRVSDRIKYHGLAALLADSLSLSHGWPSTIRKGLRDEGVARAMWELRHKDLLIGLLSVFSERGIDTIILKGTAFAYDVYANPATRVRGDTDLLVAPARLEDARSALSELGFKRTEGDGEFALQEVWSILTDSVSAHHIDLHWQLLNAHALKNVLPTEECLKGNRDLHRLSENGKSLSLANALMHACIHRALHITSPYIVKGKTFYGGDRLIWANDIHLLIGEMSESDWQAFTARAMQYGVARACLLGLQIAHGRFDTQLNPSAVRELESAKNESASNYLLVQGQISRARSELRAIEGWRTKAGFVLRRLVPSGSFMRAKYPNMGSAALWTLYLRRLSDFFRDRKMKR